MAAEPKASPISQLHEQIISQGNLNLMLVRVRQSGEDQESDQASTGPLAITLSIVSNLYMGTNLLVSVPAHSLMVLRLLAQPWYVEKVSPRALVEVEVSDVKGPWRKKSVVSATPVAILIAK